ncbi:MAG: hypothetical protein JKY37_04815 [Nannocystaceae bacterium]|nr:hypothetical protein [Nannocystaceae bacterium]
MHAHSTLTQATSLTHAAGTLQAWPTALVLALVGCGSGSQDSRPSTGVQPTVGGQDSDGTTDGGGVSTPQTTPTTGEIDEPPLDDTTADAPKFDVGGDSFCKEKPVGIFCDERTAVLCDGDGAIEDETSCAPEQCVPDLGCVACVEGQWSCKGPRLMACNTQGVAQWETSEVCDPAAQQFCDISVPGCSPLAPIGSVEPTGEYYLYSTFSPTADGFNTISDVDSFDNRIWFVGYSGSELVAGAYDVTLLDSDGDGVLEPNQHPDYVDAQGVIEERVFTFVESFPISNDGAIPHQMELHATATSLTWAGPLQISRYDLATGVTSQVAPAPPWLAGLQYKYLAFLGYDEINDVWYSGNESARRVFQYDAETMTWGYAFEFPVLSGDHMDGMDVVTDASTGTVYVYVSDMTSNFIGQYRHDPDVGWVQENLFSYAEDNGAPVEGFGLGAMNHFWVGGWAQNSFYEIGGGDLTQFLDPEG